MDTHAQRQQGAHEHGRPKKRNDLKSSRNGLSRAVEPLLRPPWIPRLVMSYVTHACDRNNSPAHAPFRLLDGSIDQSMNWAWWLGGVDLIDCRFLLIAHPRRVRRFTVITTTQKGKPKPRRWSQAGPRTRPGHTAAKDGEQLHQQPPSPAHHPLAVGYQPTRLIIVVIVIVICSTAAPK